MSQLDDMTDETRDALAMHNGAAIEIHPPQRTLSDFGNGLVESTEPPWIKLTVSMRERRLKELKGAKLSVFLCIALHINDKNESWPTGETIARETGYSEQEALRSVAELETLGLLSVVREHRRANVYCVTALAAMGKNSKPLGEVKLTKKPDNVSQDTAEVNQNTHRKLTQEEPLSRTKEEKTTTGKTPVAAPHPKPSIPPAVEAYHRATNRYPNKAVWADMSEAIGDGVTRLELWETTVKQWVLKGWRPDNIGGMFDVFKQGGFKAGTNGHGSKSAGQSPVNLRKTGGWVSAPANSKQETR